MRTQQREPSQPIYMAFLLSLVGFAAFVAALLNQLYKEFGLDEKPFSLSLKQESLLYLLAIVATIVHAYVMHIRQKPDRRTYDLVVAFGMTLYAFTYGGAWKLF